MENNLAVLLPDSTKFKDVYFYAEKCQDNIKIGYIIGRTNLSQNEEKAVVGYLLSMKGKGVNLSHTFYKEDNILFRTVKKTKDLPIKVSTKGNGCYYIFPPFELLKGGTKDFYDYILAR